MKRCVIIGAAPVKSPEKLKKFSENAFVIAADGGIYNAKAAGIIPNMIVGDFDSSKIQDAKTLYPDSVIEVYPPEKDSTDSALAYEKAIEHGADNICFFGFWSSDRPDHSLANLSLLFNSHAAGIDACIVTDNGDLFFASEKTVLPADYGRLFSLIPLEDDAVITIENAKYPLKDKHTHRFCDLCVSNVILDKDVTIYIKNSPTLLFFKDRDL